MYGNSDPVTHIDPSGRFSLVEMGVTETIRTELTSLQIDSGFSLLDNLTNGASEQFTGPLAQINQAKMMAVAMIGSASLLKMLSKKFRSSCNSFDGETLVHTKEGLKPIQDIRIGDEVLAFNEATGQEEYSPVVHLIRSDKEQGWVDVTTASGEVIQATAKHPFYARSANDPSWQWVDASQLLQGLELYTAANEADEVAGTRGYLAQRPAYNLTVDQTHTYFVGKEGVLVHNAQDVCWFEGLVIGAPKPAFRPNPKHAIGGGGRKAGEPAGLEPLDSEYVFTTQAVKSAETGHWYAMSSDGKSIYRYFEDNRGGVHWSASTGDDSAPLSVRHIPEAVKRAFGFKSKGKR